MEKEKRKMSKAVEAGVTIGIICALFFAMTNLPIIPMIEEGRMGWHPLVMPGLADDAADPGSGVSGLINISIVKHNLFDYKANFTWNTSCFASHAGGALTNNSELGANVPFGIRFDIVVKVRWNQTHAYNTSSSNWTLTWVRGNISMPRFQYQNYSLDEWNITAHTGKGCIYVHYVLGSGKGTADNGMEINRSERVPQCYFRFWAYY